LQASFRSGGRGATVFPLRGDGFQGQPEERAAEVSNLETT
jgi:hypothetical protein